MGMHTKPAGGVAGPMMAAGASAIGAAAAEQELQRFRGMLSRFLAAEQSGRMSPAQVAEAADQIATAADRLRSRLLPWQVGGEIPHSIVVRLPVYVPAHDPDRDVQILLMALDHCPVATTAAVLDRHRHTVRGTTDRARESLHREASLLLGPHFHEPPRTPSRCRPATRKAPPAAP